MILFLQNSRKLGTPRTKRQYGYSLLLRVYRARVGTEVSADPACSQVILSIELSPPGLTLCGALGHQEPRHGGWMEGPSTD